MAEFRFEKLSELISVCVTPLHKFGTDAFLLADFASPRHRDTVCDLGTGCGIIPLIMCKRHQPKHIVGVDIQPLAVEQFERGIKKSNVQATVQALCCDLNSLSALAWGTFDIVTCNPPYKAGGAGILSEQTAEQIARHEVLCTMEDICRTAAKLLTFGGKLCICQRPERLADAISAMRSAGLEPKTLRFVAKNAQAAPWLFLLEGKKGSKPFMRVFPTLSVYEDGGFSGEMKRIYGWEEKPDPALPPLGQTQ